MESELPIVHQASRRVRWRDTDASGFAHMAAYITWMEETEYEFLRSRGLSVVLSDDRGQIGFPRLSSELKIHQPVRFQQAIGVRLELTEMDGKRLSYRFQVACSDSGQLVASGAFSMACCRFPGDQLPYAILVPDWIEQRLLGGLSC